MFFNKLFFDQFYKYIIVGTLNFIFTVGIFFILLNIFNIHYIISFTLTWLIGLLFTYVLNFIWVFKPADKIEFKRRLFKYFIVYFSSYIVNILLLKYLVSKFNFDPFYIQFAIIPIVIVINFFGFKFWSLK